MQKSQLENPFLDCRVVGAEVRSLFWSVRADNERHAARIAEIIKGAYEAGRRDKMREIRLVLLGPDVAGDAEDFGW